ncbi:MAG: hypothetical protein M8364_15350 [Methylobacter sp.]|uniref:hypothetical protein n=1 Tax=Methylobacter sp. TaxID=2051955 RepID=UPI00258A3477|nr:hypothetical protein [Methylobacter sp.]MCL7422268.1 hypothetical protein [Methylobacter sp.]
MKNSFFLVIPTQQNNPQRLKEFSIKALQQWITELPTANPGLATRLLYEFIKDCNAIEMDSQMRLDALELVRPSALVIEDYLRSRLIKTGFPKEENDKKILDVLVSIEKEFTIGYWIVLKELTRRNVSWFQGKNAALAIQRCISGLSSIVISHFLMGMSIPDWVWIDLHSLYKLSIEIKKDTTKIVNDINQSNKASTPEECYKQILLLSLADPTGLMQKEILLVYSFIETIDFLVSLKSEPVAGQQMQYIISTDEDKPPYYQDSISVKNDPAALYIDFTRLFKALQQKEKMISAIEARFSPMYVSKNNSVKLSAELLDYLGQRWSGIDFQGALFFSDRLDRYIAIGLDTTFDLQNSLETDTEKNLEFLAQSSSDQLLSCVFKKTGVLSVGSLVSFRKTDMPEYKRSLGIVNKIVVSKQNGKIDFGMQLLAEQSSAVSYRQADASEKDEPQKALLYTGNEQKSEKSYIITETCMLEGDSIHLFVHDEEGFPVALKNRKNVGLGYWQFECQRIAEKEKPAQTKKGYDFI